MCFITMLLVMEYQAFRDQVHNVIALRQEYQSYIMSVKKILHDYHKTKERLEVLEAQDTTEKKTAYNDYEQLGVTAIDAGFPDGVQVFSSDDELNDYGDSFVVINRELEYLKQSTLDYLQEQNLARLAAQIKHDAWKEYTDVILEHNRAQQARSSKAKPKYRKRRTIATARQRAVVRDMMFMWPIKRSDFWLSSFFGLRKKVNGSKGFHYGIDMAAVKGTPVKAAAPGRIIEARHTSGYGNTIVIAHNSKYRTRYAHLDTIFVRVGQRVTRGSLIGKVGDTGFVRKSGKDASHLHFEVYAFGKRVNPMYFLS